jgi:vitamin B12 transporter
MNLIFLAAAAATIDPTIVVTAAREPVRADLSGASITVLDRATVEALNVAQTADLLRLSPGVSVSQAGPIGAQTQVRIRGAESNHTLVFVDGIEVNDPASSGDFRFETLLADGLERIEVLRGPQSALWGPEAIGGVVSVTTREPGGDAPLFGHAEYGSFRTWRAGGGVEVGSADNGIVAQVNHIDTRGIDAAGDGGERDGYENLSLSLKGVAQPTATTKVGAVARYSTAETAPTPSPSSAPTRSTRRASAGWRRGCGARRRSSTTAGRTASRVSISIPTTSTATARPSSTAPTPGG